VTAADRIAQAANERVTGWPSLTRIPGTYIKCESGGWLIEVGDAFPVWRADMGAVRRLLLEQDLLAAEVDDAA
jgi:hypothetical protein